MSDNGCAGRIRYQYQSQFGNGADLPVELLHRMAVDIAGQCGHTLLKAHRLAWGWTVTQAVDAFHQMCRREKIKPRGLVARSWMDWEAGSRPNWDYQDLLSRLFHTSPVHLGWAADYTPAEPPAARRVLAGAAAVSFAGGTPGVREQLIATNVRQGRALLHLPPDTRDFTGRTEQVGEVSRLMAAAAAYSGTALPIVCLSGQAGIGKTTLAIHVAHRVGGEFSDGQLYTNLRGADSRGQDPADVLAGFLRELGVEGTDIPEGLDERARMYRAQLADRRMLVVLDNAADEAQVRPLLPGSPGCAVLITSTSRLAALAGATAVPLDLMPPGQATELLTAIIGEARAQAEPEAVGEVAQLCGYLPLALRIAGARLVSRPAWKVSWFAARLADESKRLDLLKAGDLEIRASSGLSYRGRPETEQRAFRMLGLLAADFPAWNLAAVLETDTDDAEELLEQLVDAVLADIAGVDATGLIRYRLHDLLRAFAKECLTEAEPPGVREECLARLADQYIGAARLASALVQPGTPDIAAPARALLMEDVVRGDPRGWFMAERASLVRLVEQAHAARLQSRTWQLAELLPVMFDWRADWRSWEHTHQLALDAARQAGDADAEAGILRSLGALYRELGRYDESVTMLTRAAAIFEGHADQRRWAAVLRNLGDTYRYQGRLAEAIETFSAGLAVFRSAGDARSQAGALNGIADAHRGLSQWDQARSSFGACIGIYHDLADRLEEARAKIRYSLVFRDQYLSEQALPLLEEGLRVVRELGDRRWEARAIRQLAIVHRNDGDTKTAIAMLAECMSIFGELEDRRGMAVVFRNRGDAWRRAGELDEAGGDLSCALEAFHAIGDRRWTARTQLSIADLARIRRDWTAGRQHLDAALTAFRTIGDRAAEGRALRELGMLLRDQGEMAGSGAALDASRAIFEELGDVLWTARVLACRSAVEEMRGGDSGSLMDEARTLCRHGGIVSEDKIASALREW